MNDKTDRKSDEIVRVAWLYYVGGLGQEGIARRLGVSRFRITRMLAQAREAGIVKISIRHATTATLVMAEKLCRRFDLRECIVTPPLGSLPVRDKDDSAALNAAQRAVGIAAARFLGRRLQNRAPVTIGVGWGRTLAALADSFSGVRQTRARFVSLMGSLTRNSATNPFDVVLNLARSCGGEAHYFPAPFVANSQPDLAVIMSQQIVRETLELARAADFYMVSLGECTRQSLIYRSGLISDRELASLQQAGAVADTTGVFLDRDGRLVEADITRRTAGVGADELRRHELVLLAAGQQKAKALVALLKSGMVDRLIIDGDLAQRIETMETGNQDNFIDKGGEKS